MTEEADSTAEPGQRRRPIVVAAEFAAANFNAVAQGIETCEGHAFQKAFGDAHDLAQAEARLADVKVFALLAALSTMVLRPEDRARPWGPMVVFTDGAQFPVPEDFRGAQSAELEMVLPTIEHPALRARIGDLIWTNHRNRRDAALIAFESYCDCVYGLLSEKLKPAYERPAKASLEIVNYIQRAFQLAYATHKRGALPERLSRCWRACYDMALKELAYVPFIRIANIGLYYEQIGAREVAVDAEKLATSKGDKNYTLAVQGVWELGEHLYTKLNDKEGRRRCQVGGLEQTLAMRKQVSGAGAEAHWVMKALQALRHIEGLEELEVELEVELRRLQKASLREMAPFSIPLGLEPYRTETTAAFDALSLAEALLHFTHLNKSRSPDELKAEARETLKNYPLSAMFGGVHLDDDGKPIGYTPGASDNKEPDEAWYLNRIEQTESLSRAHFVGGFLDPARTSIMARFDIAERHFMPIVARSPLIPSSHDLLMAHGFARFFQGDFMSALHVLVPQLEPCLRHILKLTGVSAVKRFEDGTEEDMDLGNMLDRCREPLDRIFGPAITYEIERLFNARPGLRLRHVIAHGQVGAGGCYSSDAQYACWFIFRLCALFVSKEWADQIVPELELEAG